MRTRNSCREGFIHKPDESECAPRFGHFVYLCIYLGALRVFSHFYASYGIKKQPNTSVSFFFTVNSGTTNTVRLLVVMELGNTSAGDRNSCRTPRCALLFVEAPCTRMWGLSCCYEPLCCVDVWQLWPHRSMRWTRKAHT